MAALFDMVLDGVQSLSRCVWEGEERHVFLQNKEIILPCQKKVVSLQTQLERENEAES